MGPIYVFAASRMEGRPVERLAATRTGAPGIGLAEVRLADASRIRLIITGIGPRHAEQNARSAFGLGEADPPKTGDEGTRPAVVIVIGLCGAVSPSLQEADLVTYTDVVSTEGHQPPLSCARNLRERITNGLSSKGMRCVPVVGISSPQVAVTRKEKLALAQKGAAVVDMESYAVLSAAVEAEVPAAVLRVVSDSLDARIPDFTSAVGADGQIEAGKAARIAARHPLQTARLLLGSQRAMRKLSRALGLLVGSDVLEVLSASARETPGATS
ncbi:MAG: hypothetical protein ACRD10_09360 [Terriglobia bacterium]